MWRRGNQSDAGNGMPDAGYDFVNFVAGELATLAGFRSLRHFDLQLVRVYQIVCGYAEPRRGHLLDSAAAQIAAGIGLETFFVFSTFAGVGLATDAVHGDG